MKAKLEYIFIIEDSYEVYTARQLKAKLEHFKDFKTCDLDEREYDISLNLRWEFQQNKIISKYEDELYYAGENYEKFLDWLNKNINQEQFTLEVNYD